MAAWVAGVCDVLTWRQPGVRAALTLPLPRDLKGHPFPGRQECFSLCTAGGPFTVWATREALSVWCPGPEGAPEPRGLTLSSAYAQRSFRSRAPGPRQKRGIRCRDLHTAGSDCCGVHSPSVRRCVCSVYTRCRWKKYLHAVNKLVLFIVHLLVACRIFRYGMWNLVPWPEIKPGTSALGV